MREDAELSGMAHSQAETEMQVEAGMQAGTEAKGLMVTSSRINSCEM